MFEGCKTVFAPTHHQSFLSPCLREFAPTHNQSCLSVYLSVCIALAPTAGLCTHPYPLSKETCFTGLETGCKPVLFNTAPKIFFNNNLSQS